LLFIISVSIAKINTGPKMLRRKENIILVVYMFAGKNNINTVKNFASPAGQKPSHHKRNDTMNAYITVRTTDNRLVNTPPKIV